MVDIVNYQSYYNNSVLVVDENRYNVIQVYSYEYFDGSINYGIQRYGKENKKSKCNDFYFKTKEDILKFVEYLEDCINGNESTHTIYNKRFDDEDYGRLDIYKDGFMFICIDRFDSSEKKRREKCVWSAVLTKQVASELCNKIKEKIIEWDK